MGASLSTVSTTMPTGPALASERPNSSSTAAPGILPPGATLPPGTPPVVGGGGSIAELVAQLNAAVAQLAKALPGLAGPGTLPPGTPGSTTAGGPGSASPMQGCTCAAMDASKGAKETKPKKKGAGHKDTGKDKGTPPPKGGGPTAPPTTPPGTQPPAPGSTSPGTPPGTPPSLPPAPPLPPS